MREKVGDGPFFDPADVGGRAPETAVTTEEFIVLSEQISGQNLSTSFQVWHYTPQSPRAGDSLVASYHSVHALRFLAGSFAAGLLGSAAYAQRHGASGLRGV